MHIKNIFLLGVFIFSLLTPTQFNATPTTNNLTHTDKLDVKNAEKTKKRTQRVKKWKYKKALLKKFLSKEFVIDDLENIHLLEGCEKIKFSNGTVLKVEIISMDDLYVTYKPCGSDDSEESKSTLRDISTIYDSTGDLIYKGGKSVANDSKILTFSIISLVSAFLSLFFPIGILFGPVAIIFGALALRRINASDDPQNGRGLALGGFISGIVITALSLILLILLVFFWF